MENPITMGDLGVPLFLETTMFIYNFIKAFKYSNIKPSFFP